MKLKNVKIVRKSLASGEVREFYYHRPTGIALGCDPVEVRRKWDELERERADSVKMKRGDPGTIGWLIGSYYDNYRFEKLSKRSQADYRRHLEFFREQFGHLPIHAITPRFVEKFRDKGKAIPFQTNYRLAVLRRVWGVGVKLGAAEINPFSKPERLAVKRRRTLWAPEDAGKFLSFVWKRPTARNGAFRMEPLPEYLALAFLIGLYTAQREGDVLRLTWGQYRIDKQKRAWLRLTQAKTKVLLEIPVHAELREALDKARCESGPIVRGPTGKALTEDRFIKKFGQWKGLAGLKHLRFQDLRRTSMVRMAEAGIPIQRIAAISGHTIEQTQRILEHYIPRTKQMALDAITTLEAAEPLIHRPGKVA